MCVRLDISRARAKVVAGVLPEKGGEKRVGNASFSRVAISSSSNLPSCCPHQVVLALLFWIAHTPGISVGLLRRSGH